MLDRDEVLRYIGAVQNNDTINSMINRAEDEVIRTSRPKHIARLVSIEVIASEDCIILDGTPIKSRDLSQHLEGCQQGFLFASTLGVGVDSLVKRYSITNVPMLPVVQAVAAAYIEHYTDIAQKELEDYAEQNKMYLRPRYSPGYGDFQLENQRIVFNMLEISKKIGVTLTENFLMVPFKSITAIIGLSRDPSLCHINKCMSCSMKNCPFRRKKY